MSTASKFFIEIDIFDAPVHCMYIVILRHIIVGCQVLAEIHRATSFISFLGFIVPSNGLSFNLFVNLIVLFFNFISRVCPRETTRQPIHCIGGNIVMNVMCVVLMYDVYVCSWYNFAINAVNRLPYCLTWVVCHSLYLCIHEIRLKSMPILEWANYFCQAVYFLVHRSKLKTVDLD